MHQRNGPYSLVAQGVESAAAPEKARCFRGKGIAMVPWESSCAHDQVQDHDLVVAGIVQPGQKLRLGKTHQQHQMDHEPSPFVQGNPVLQHSALLLTFLLRDASECQGKRRSWRTILCTYPQVCICFQQPAESGRRVGAVLDLCLHQLNGAHQGWRNPNMAAASPVLWAGDLQPENRSFARGRTRHEVFVAPLRPHQFLEGVSLTT